MAKTLLQIISQAQQELGLPMAATIAGNSDPATLQMFGLLNSLGEELRDYPEEGWMAQEVEFNIVVNTPIMMTGNVSAGSGAVITNLSSTTGLSASNWVVTGPNVSQAARIKSVDSPTQVTMNMLTTGPSTGGMFVFAQDTYPMPTDFKYQQNRTWWDRTNRWELLGPDSPQMDQWHRSGIVATGPRRHFRIIGPPTGNQYRLWPPPVEIINPLQLVFEYQSTNWVALNGNGATTSNAFINDNDQSFLDDRALINGLKWKYWEIKGFNFTNMKNDWIDLVDALVSRDGAADTLSIVKRVHPLFISPSNVQDGFYPGPTGPNMGQ